MTNQIQEELRIKSIELVPNKDTIKIDDLIKSAQKIYDFIFSQEVSRREK